MWSSVYMKEARKQLDFKRFNGCGAVSLVTPFDPQLSCNLIWFFKYRMGRNNNKSGGGLVSLTIKMFIYQQYVLITSFSFFPPWFPPKNQKKKQITCRKLASNIKNNNNSSSSSSNNNNNNKIFPKKCTNLRWVITIVLMAEILTN